MRPFEAPARRRVWSRSWQAAVALLLVFAPVVVAETATAPRAAVTLGTGSELWIEGKSTVHEWHSRTSSLGFALMRDAAQADPADAAALDAWLRAGGLRGLDLVVPLATMRSGKPALDKNMLKALRAEKYPEIHFALSAARLGTAHGDTLPVSAEGALTVSGVTHAITVKGQLLHSDKGVRLEGSHTLRMTEYEVKPPVMMLGTLRVADPITILFRLLLVPGEAGGTTSVSKH